MGAKYPNKMKNKIREKRKLAFSGKIFTPETVRQLAKIVHQEASDIMVSNKESVTTLYSFDSVDNSSFESEQPTIFEKEGLIEQKLMNRINIRLQTFDNSKNIEILISSSQDDDPVNNFILVGGDDSIWVNGIVSRFSEILNLAKSRKSMNSQIDISTFLSLIAFNIIYYRLFYSSIQKIGNEFLKTWVLVLGVSIGSMIFFQKLSEYLKTLWPSVELQTGTSYMQIPYQKRVKLKWILSAIGLPLLLGLIYDLLKNVILIGK
jgi:hypothetical protein